MKKPKIHIDITSDFICPWCFIGITRIDRIKKTLSPNIDLEVQLKPYLLYPNIPLLGSPKKHFAKKSKPGMGRALKVEALKENIKIDYKKIDRIPNSLEAHRIISLVNDQDKKWALAKAIFIAYFENGRDIGNSDVLVEIAEQLGSELSTLNAFSHSNVGKEAVLTQVKEAAEKFINVVPTLDFDGRLMVPGLQEEAFWTRYIKKAALLQQS